MKKLSKMLLLISGSLVLTACPLFDFANTPVSKITLNETYVEMAKGDTKQLTASVKPITASNKTVEWSSSETDVCTVTERGKVTALEYGIATIRATAKDDSGVYAECVFDIKQPGAVLNSIEVVDADDTFYTGDVFRKSKIVAHYVGGTTRTVTDGATFSGYNLYQAGTCTVNVSYTENSITKTTSYEITVVESGVDSGKTVIRQSYMDFAKNNVSNVDYTPNKGEPRLLVIPIWFTDSGNYIDINKRENVRSDIEKAYFGTDADTGWKSVKSFYYEESHGLVNLTGTVSEWYEITSSSSFYKSETYQSRTADLVKSSVSWYFSNHTESRKSYDSNGDGRLDGVMLIYGSPNYATLGEDSGNLWAYCFWLQDTNPSSFSPTPNVYFWASYDFMYGYSNAYSRTGHNYHYGETSHCNIDTHTYIHEMGHCFGLDDYYDYSGQYDPAGTVTMQDNNVGGHDPFSTMALGWTKPYIPTESVTLKIKPFQSSGDMILLTPSWNSYDSPFDEYLLLEYYTPTGLNEFDALHAYGTRPRLPSFAGIRLWHVDARLVWRDNLHSYRITSLVSDATNTSRLVTHAFSNTYSGGVASDQYLSPLGTVTLGGLEIDTSNFNLLQYIRNNTAETYKPNREDSHISDLNMFMAGSSFSMDRYQRQFVCGTKLNSTNDLGWTFRVVSITSQEATIELTKAA